ncbi:hypothetical protein QWY81_11770 [Polaribacter undariae]|uniref:Uncharacterized protein n=1 Tax=Polaribacter sejongensis TaxID=985043 RepID=A0AAJ1QY85_9FLAO|nr:hypothetical protein [Polaribacter undariae]MDN3620133.1 hypothetical protein [Polaribacter undariae]UWD32536.1 hypothetical protein NQP51_02420 [Polaribacter undariae]
MHGAFGALTTLIKKQEAAKNRKVSLKYELQNRKEGFFTNSSRHELKFPEISKTEMKILKEEIRKKYKAARIKNIAVNFLIIIFVLLIFYLIGSIRK